MAVVMAEDPLFESLQVLPSKIDSFAKSLFQVCKSNNAGAAAFCKEMEDHYHDLHRNVQHMFEELTRKEKALEANAAQKLSVNTEVSRARVPAFAEVEVRQEIRSLCDSMDGQGLRNFIVDNRKQVGPLRGELPSALYKAPDSARLVLKALEGYDFSETDDFRADKKEPGAAVNRRACILLLECLVPVLEAAPSNVSSDVKNKAKELAKSWGKRMGIEINASSCNLLDAQAFLQLLATFGIVSEFEEDLLCDLVVVIARNKQTRTLCKSLGLAPRIPDILDKLCKSGKQIEAIAFAHDFDMMDKVEPVSLLKAYLKDNQEAALALLERGQASLVSQNNASMKEISGLNTVIKAVKDYNLGNLYPTDQLHKRIAQLEKSKANRKKQVNRGPQKRHRSSVSGDDTETEVPLPVDRIKLPDAEYDVARTGVAAVVGRVPYSSDGNQGKNEARSPKRYALSYDGANAGVVGSSIYGSGAAAGGAFATRSSNLVQSNYEKGGPETVTPVFSGINRSPSRSAAGNFATVFPNGPPSIHEKRGYENYASSFAGKNVSSDGSSVYGSGPTTAVLSTPYSNVAQRNYETRGTQHSYEKRGPESYPSTLSSNRGFSGLSAYGSDMFPFPSSAVQSNYENRRTERSIPAFDSVDRRSMSSSAYGSGASAAHTAPSAFHGYQFDAVDRRSMSSSVYGSGAPNAVHTTPSSTVRGYQSSSADGRSKSSSMYESGAPNAVHPTPSSTVSGYQFDSADGRSKSSSIYGSGASASANATSSSTFHGYQFDGGLPSSSMAYRDSFQH